MTPFDNLDLAVRLATLEAARAIPDDQTPEDLAQQDEEITALKATLDEIRTAGDVTLADVFVEVLALHGMFQSMDIAINSTCRALAAVLGEGKAQEFRNAADVVESWRDDAQQEITTIRAHGHDTAAHLLRTMAATIELGTDVQSRTVPGVRSRQ